MYFVVQSLSCVHLFVTPVDCNMPDIPVLHYLSEFAQVHVQWVSDAIQPSHPLSLSSFAFSLSQHQGLFQWVGSSHQMAIVLELQQQFFQWIFSDDVPAVQRTLKSLLQHYNLKASILWCSAFFMVQLSHLYMTTGKNHRFDHMRFLSAKWYLSFLISCLGWS